MGRKGEGNGRKIGRKRKEYGKENIIKIKEKGMVEGKRNEKEIWGEKTE